MTTVVEVEMGCLKYVTLDLCTFMLQNLTSTHDLHMNQLCTQVFYFYFFCNFVIKQQHGWSSTREISQIELYRSRGKVENFKECDYVFATFRRKKIPSNFGDFGICCSQESFVWITLNVFLWPSQELAQKKKKHWLWILDGQHLFYSWKKWKKDHNAFTCTMTQTLTTMDSYFSFEWTLDSRP